MTTETVPVVDRLFAFIAHLAQANQADLAEHVANIGGMYGTDIDLQFKSGHRAELLALAATLPDPQLSVKHYTASTKDDHDWFLLDVRSAIGAVPVNAWVRIAGTEVDQGDTVESVVDAARRDLSALLDSREG